MRPEIGAPLWDAIRALRRVDSFVSGRTLADYHGDLMLRLAIERLFTIAGEALGQFRKSDPDAARRVTDLPRVVGLRNVLMHGYATVDNATIWEIATVNVRPLLDELEPLLTTVEGPDDL